MISFQKNKRTTQGGENEYKKEGNYTFEYNASRLSSGVYFYRLESSNFVDTKRMILIK